MKQLSFTNMDISDFCRQLALLIQAGVNLSDGLVLLSEEETNPVSISFLKDLAAQIDQGSYFYSVLESSGCFPVHMTGLIKVGEEVGRLEETLFSLSRYYEEREYTKQHIKNALTYPILLFIMMASVIIVLLSQVLPVFENVYASLGGSLNGLAKSLLSLGGFFNRIMPFLMILLIGILFCLFLIAFVPGLQNRLSSFWFRHYGDKGISRKINDAHFAQALSMALSSGMPFEDAILLASTILKDCPDAARRCHACLASLDSGEDFSNALKSSGMLPASYCRMLTLGVRAGTGDRVMEDIARRLSEEAANALASRLSVIEPALVIVTSLLVGMILFSVMLPLMNIMKTIG